MRLVFRVPRGILQKTKELPLGTISSKTGLKKVGKNKWVPVKKGKKPTRVLSPEEKQYKKEKKTEVAFKQVSKPKVRYRKHKTPVGKKEPKQKQPTKTIEFLQREKKQKGKLKFGLWKESKEHKAEIETKIKEQKQRIAEQYEKADIKEKPTGLLLSTLTTEDVKRLKRGTQFRNKFIIEHQPFITDTINRFRSQVQSFFEAKQNANEGFIQAVNHFNVERSPKGFLSYVRSYMRGFVLKAMWKQFVKEKEAGKELSLEAKVTSTGGGDREIALGQTIADVSGEKGIERAEMTQNIKMLRTAVERQSPRAAEVLDYLAKGYGPTKIAEILGTKKANISKLVGKFIRPIAKKYLGTYLGKSEAWQEVLEFLNFLDAIANGSLE